MLGICQDQPVQLVWSGRAIPQNRPPLYTNLKKLMWTGLQSVHPQSYDMINRMSRDTASQSAMVTEVAAGRRAGASEAAIFGHVACKWIKANAATWIKWIPRVCPSGQAFLRDTGTCTPCPVGTASPYGKSCVACSDGELTTTIGAASCDFCPAGQWRVGSEAVCSDCPAGTQRAPLIDMAGCRPCSHGSYSTSNGKEECSLCPIGSFQPATNATTCNTCPEGQTTLVSGAKSADSCVCVAGSTPSADGMECTSCGPLRISSAGDLTCSIDNEAVGMLLVGIFGSFLILGGFFLIIRKLHRLERKNREELHAKLAKNLDDSKELSFPMCLLKMSEFCQLGQLVMYEKIRSDVGVRTSSQYRFLDNAHDIEELKTSGASIIFFSQCAHPERAFCVHCACMQPRLTP